MVSWNPVNITMLAVRAKNLAWIYDISTGVLVQIFPTEIGGYFTIPKSRDESKTTMVTGVKPKSWGGF